MDYGVSYLSLVNSVLAELREAPVTTVNSTDYSRLIGALVNRAKSVVESAYEWSTLRHEEQVTTTPGTLVYTVPNTRPGSRILNGWNDTANAAMAVMTEAKALASRLIYPQVQRSPVYYRVVGLDTSTQRLKVQVYPTPAVAETLVFTCYTIPGPLSADADILRVPSLPVIAGAVAFARHERGEDGGVTQEQSLAVMNRLLAAAISLDAANTPDRFFWEAV